MKTFQICLSFLCALCFCREFASGDGGDDVTLPVWLTFAEQGCCDAAPRLAEAVNVKFEFAAKDHDIFLKWTYCAIAQRAERE